MIVTPSNLNIVDSEDVQNEVSLSLNTTNNIILDYTTKNNLKAYLAFVGMAWDFALDTFITWRVTRNDGAVIYNLRDSRVQIAAPDEPQNELAPYIELPQGCRILLLADLGAASTPGNVSGRFKVYYTPLNQNEGGS